MERYGELLNLYFVLSITAIKINECVMDETCHALN